MRHPSSVYSLVRLRSRTRRILVAVVAAAAVLLGLAVPALASAGHASSTATTRVTGHGLAQHSFRPLITRVSGGSIAGHIFYPPNSDSYVFDTSVTVRAPGYVRTVYANSAGNYRVYDLPPDSYRVTFNRTSGFALSAAQFYNGHDESAGVGSADRVTVTAGQTTDSINADLHLGGEITGHLYGPVGQPLSCIVQAYTPDNSLVTRYAYSYNDGSFDIPGLTTGSYDVRVIPSGDCALGTKYLGTSPSLSATGPGTPRAVTQGDATEVGSLIYGSPALPPVKPPVVIPPTPAPTPAPAFVVTHKTKVPGPTVVGSKVKVKLATLSPSATKVSFRWLLNGHKVKGAKHKSFKITDAAAGKKLSVRVTYERPGYPDLVVVTKVGRVHVPKGHRG